VTSRAYAARGVRLAPRRHGSRIHWDRLGRVVLVFVLFAVLASYLNPLVNFFHTWQDARSGKTALVKLRAENTSLRSQARALSNPAVLVRVARDQGMVRPGEQSYVIHGLPR
jgi:cell division protein FtsB